MTFEEWWNQNWSGRVGLAIKTVAHEAWDAGHGAAINSIASGE